MPTADVTVTELLDELRAVGKDLPPDLRERIVAVGRAAVGPLIAMVGDQSLIEADEDDPAGWAPLHAIRLLGEMRGPEAIEPLLAVLRTDYDYLRENAQEALGQIGEPAFEPLRAMLFDRDEQLYDRVAAGTALTHMAQEYPELRDAVVVTLAARLDPDETQSPEDEELNAFVVSDLLDLDAKEAEAAILRAFREDRVNHGIVDEGDLARSGLDTTTLKPSPVDAGRGRLLLRCTACGYERPHDVCAVYYDLGTQERRSRGEETRYDPYIITRRITCPKCGAQDQYELSNQAHLALAGHLMRATLGETLGFAQESSEQPLQMVHFTLTDGTEMHPLEARDMYQERVAAEPDRPDLRIKYGNVLVRLGYDAEAEEQYRTAIRLDPRAVEAYLSLGRILDERGQRDDARSTFEQLLRVAAESGLPRQDVADEVTYAQDWLAGRPTGEPSLIGRLVYPDAAPAPAQPLAPSPQPAPSHRKIGRNEPCWCGSGKKYKHCHLRADEMA